MCITVDNELNLLNFEKTIKAQLHERANSPLFGAFSISWVIWNYKFLVILFSSAEVKEKIHLIETTVFSNVAIELNILGYNFYATKCMMNGLIYPLIMALTFILIYPWPSMMVLRIHGIIKNKQKKIQITNDNETPISQSEVNERTDSYLRDIESYKSKIAQYQKENLELINQVNSYDQQGKQTSEQTIKITENEQRIRELEGKSEFLVNEINVLAKIKIDIRSLLMRPDESSSTNNDLDELFTHGDVNRETIFVVLIVAQEQQTTYKQLIYLTSHFLGNVFIAKYFIEKAFDGGFFDSNEFKINGISIGDTEKQIIIKLSGSGITLLADPQNKALISDFSKIIKQSKSNE